MLRKMPQIKLTTSQIYSHVYYRRWDYPKFLKADIQAISLLHHITLYIAYSFLSSLFSIFFSAEQNFAQLKNLKAVTGYIFLMSNIYNRGLMGVNRSSWFKSFLIQNFMNIDGMMLFLFFLSPWFFAGPQ